MITLSSNPAIAEAFNSALAEYKLEGICPNAPEKLAVYYQLLCNYNEQMNLVGNTDFDDALVRHYIDSFAPLEQTQLFENVKTIVDVGTGAGFPGMVLAIIRPDWEVTLVDSLNKRLAFLKVVADTLSLTNVHFEHMRAEVAGHQPHLREQFDIALSRAVAPLNVLCEYLLPLVKIGGRMIAYKGPAAPIELAKATGVARKLGGAPSAAFGVNLPANTPWTRTLVTSRKIEITDPKYPRREGIPTKKPL